tara:strand:+ start:270 stop:605 length:336 start_codon:yes stop_codon:yes gene_type:complete
MSTEYEIVDEYLENHPVDKREVINNLNDFDLKLEKTDKQDILITDGEKYIWLWCDKQGRISKGTRYGISNIWNENLINRLEQLFTKLCDTDMKFIDEHSEEYFMVHPIHTD